MNKTSSEIAVVIVNYMTPNLVVGCVKSLIPELKNIGNNQIVIVDNKSPDDSVSILKLFIKGSRLDEQVFLVESPVNGGFSSGNNLGIAFALEISAEIDYFYLLNPDTLMHQDGIAALLKVMDNDKQIGVVGGSMESDDGVLQSSARKFPTAITELLSSARFSRLSSFFNQQTVSMPYETKLHECDWVSGASLMIRKNVIDQCGMMDENYFLYFEELDYCFNVKKKGFTIFFEPQSRITHIGGAATNIDKKQRRPAYWYNSRRRFFIKNYGVFRFLLVDLCWAVGRLSFNIRRLLRMGTNFSSAESDPYWYAWDLLVGDFIAIFKRKTGGKSVTSTENIKK